MKFAVLAAHAITLLLALPSAPAQEMREAPRLEAIFAAQKMAGTFVLNDLAKKEIVVFNRARAGKRFIPASTFKIPNTVIGLDTGAVRDVDEVLPYGGKPQFIKEWEHDMPLREAMPLSAVPIYQELARRIGLARMAAAVKSLEYGNQRIGDVVDKFWLVGPLEISAIEQTQFLARLVQYQLPVSPRAVAAVAEITLQEKSGETEVHYKTGWQGREGEQVGWLVGWVQGPAGVSTFALNFPMATIEEAPKRWQVARQCLVALGKLK